MSEASPTKAGGLPSAAVVVVLACALAVLIALGTWQVYRLQWKEGLLADIDARTKAPAVSLVDMEKRRAEEGTVEYWPVTVKGEFLHASERHFFSTWKGQSGFNVYTPLELGDGRVVFVNRGFVPYDRKAAETRANGQVTGTVTVTGLARDALQEKPSFIVPDNEPEKNVFYWKDLSAMAATAGLPVDTETVPFFIDAGDAPNPGGLPVGGVTLIDLPNNHLQYAVTWYGLALALVGVAVFRFRRRRTV